MPTLYENSGMTLYNVRWAVGDGMPNNSDDVLLVQWMLKRHFMRSDKQALLGKQWQIHALTGSCGEELVEIIKIFQYDIALNTWGSKMKLDGKIYPIQSCHGGVNHSPMMYLNFSVQSHFKKYYENPATDPLVIGGVREMLTRSLRLRAAA
jgi:hypothetical protein